MSQKRLAELLSEAKSLVREVEEEKAQETIRSYLEDANKDPLAMYKRLKWYPRYVVWELTLACNLRCAHCGSTAGVRREDELTPEQMLRVCDELGELECERLTLLGGEPLIHPHWQEVTGRLQENGVRVNVITNGWTLDDEKLVDRLQAAGLTIIGISIDGLKTSHDKLRRDGSFDRIARGLKLLKARSIPAAVCTVITSDSIKDLEGLYDFIAEHGVKVWQLQIASPLGRLKPGDPILIKPEQIQYLYDFFNEKRRADPPFHMDLADDIGYYPPFKEGYIRNTRKKGTLWTGCNAGIQVLGIDSNGDIKGCQSLPSQPPYIEGNVKLRSLKDIWNDPQSFRYNRQFAMKDLSGYCAQCEYGALCRGGCSSAAISHTGSKGNNPMCLYRVYKEKKP